MKKMRHFLLFCLESAIFFVIFIVLRGNGLVYLLDIKLPMDFADTIL